MLHTYLCVCVCELYQRSENVASVVGRIIITNNFNDDNHIAL